MDTCPRLEGWEIGVWGPKIQVEGLVVCRACVLIPHGPAAHQFPLSRFTSLRSTHLPSLPSSHFLIYNFASTIKNISFSLSYSFLLASQSKKANPQTQQGQDKQTHWNHLLRRGVKQVGHPSVLGVTHAFPEAHLEMK